MGFEGVGIDAGGYGESTCQISALYDKRFKSYKGKIIGQVDENQP